MCQCNDQRFDELNAKLDKIAAMLQPQPLIYPSLSRRQTARELKCSVRTVSELVEHGKLKPNRLGKIPIEQVQAVRG
jgi:hypothetical protein